MAGPCTLPERNTFLPRQYKLRQGNASRRLERARAGSGHTWEHLEAPVAAKGLLSQLLSPYIAVLSEGPKPSLDQLTWGLALSLPGACPTNQG